MNGCDVTLRISNNQETERNIHRIFQFLSIVARPPKGAWSEETEWRRKDHKGPRVSTHDIEAVTGAAPADIELALKTLNEVDLLFCENTEDGPVYALKRFWNGLFLDVEKYGWTRFGETLRRAAAATESKKASTTNRWGNWELHNSGHIVTIEYDQAFDEQFSYATEKGKAALKVLEIFFPFENEAATSA